MQKRREDGLGHIVSNEEIAIRTSEIPAEAGPSLSK